MLPRQPHELLAELKDKDEEIRSLRAKNATLSTLLKGGNANSLSAVNDHEQKLNEIHDEKIAELEKDRDEQDRLTSQFRNEAQAEKEANKNLQRENDKLAAQLKEREQREKTLQSQNAELTESLRSKTAESAIRAASSEQQHDEHRLKNAANANVIAEQAKIIAERDAEIASLKKQVAEKDIAVQQNNEPVIIAQVKNPSEKTAWWKYAVVGGLLVLGIGACFTGLGALVGVPLLATIGTIAVVSLIGAGTVTSVAAASYLTHASNSDEKADKEHQKDINAVNEKNRAAVAIHANKQPASVVAQPRPQSRRSSSAGDLPFLQREKIDRSDVSNISHFRPAATDRSAPAAQPSSDNKKTI